jgi:hypothetical protein
MTFKELEFNPHRVDPTVIQARAYFPNGYELSIIGGDSFYGNGKDTFEVAILKNGQLCYDSPLTDDVLKFQTPEDIDNILQEVESYLP